MAIGRRLAPVFPLTRLVLLPELEVLNPPLKIPPCVQLLVTVDHLLVPAGRERKDRR